MVAWRGTVTRLEWLEDLDGALITPASVDSTAVAVERGFWTLYTSSKDDGPHGKQSAAQQVREELLRLIEQYSRAEKRQLSITMTGHSLGGALALLSAFHVASCGVNKSAGATIPVSVISFAAPRVGNEAFKHRLEEAGVKALRVVNANDVVPKVPGIFLHHDHPASSDVVEHATEAGLFHFHVGAQHEDGDWKAYAHVGVELRLDNRHSPFLKSANPVDSHNLELYLHLVDGYRSANEPFIGQHDHYHPNHLQLCMGLMKRDVVLVNKTSGLLLDELQVPARWQARNLRRPTLRLSSTTTPRSNSSHHAVPDLILRRLTGATDLLMA